MDVEMIRKKKKAVFNHSMSNLDKYFTFMKGFKDKVAERRPQKYATVEAQVAYDTGWQHGGNVLAEAFQRATKETGFRPSAFVTGEHDIENV